MKKCAIGLVSILLLLSCASFIKDQDRPALLEYEKGEYVLKADAGTPRNSIRKGQAVRLQVMADKDYIKVYAWPSGTDFLKAEKVLVLYMFEDDFSSKAFDRGVFEERLFAVMDVKKSK
jgi:type II secretion system-associated lipoprotein